MCIKTVFHSMRCTVPPAGARKPGETVWPCCPRCKHDAAIKPWLRCDFGHRCCRMSVRIKKCGKPNCRGAVYTHVYERCTSRWTECGDHDGEEEEEEEKEEEEEEERQRERILADSTLFAVIQAVQAEVDVATKRLQGKITKMRRHLDTVRTHVMSSQHNLCGIARNWQVYRGERLVSQCDADKVLESLPRQIRSVHLEQTLLKETTAALREFATVPTGESGRAVSALPEIIVGPQQEAAPSPRWSSREITPALTTSDDEFDEHQPTIFAADNTKLVGRMKLALYPEAEDMGLWGYRLGRLELAVGAVSGGRTGTVGWLLRVVVTVS